MVQIFSHLETHQCFDQKFFLAGPRHNLLMNRTAIDHLDGVHLESKPHVRLSHQACRILPHYKSLFTLIEWPLPGAFLCSARQKECRI